MPGLQYPDQWWRALATMLITSCDVIAIEDLYAAATLKNTHWLVRLPRWNLGNYGVRWNIERLSAGRRSS
jgi:hypothetical protein